MIDCHAFGDDFYGWSDDRKYVDIHTGIGMSVSVPKIIVPRAKSAIFTTIKLEPSR